jgi:hypothetical protein
MKKLVVTIAVMLMIAGAVSAFLMQSGVVLEKEPHEETAQIEEQAEEETQAETWIRLNRGALISRKYNDTWIITIGPILNLNNMSLTVTDVVGNLTLAWVEADGVKMTLPAEILPHEEFTICLELSEASGYRSSMTVKFTVLSTRQDFPVSVKLM